MTIKLAAPIAILTLLPFLIALTATVARWNYEAGHSRLFAVNVSCLLIQCACAAVMIYLIASQVK